MSINDLVYTFLTALAALFPVMNPISSGFIVNGFLADVDEEHRKVYIRKIIRNTLLVGLGSLAAGHLILLLFGLAIPVIQVGGGIIIAKTGWEWLSDKGASVSMQNKEKTISQIDLSDVERKLFYPISFPISIGPGSISIIFTLMAGAVVKGKVVQTGVNYFMIVLSIAVLCAILYAFLTQGNRIIRRLGASGTLIINKLVAFITLCIGIQIIVTGISKIFHIAVL